MDGVYDADVVIVGLGPVGAVAANLAGAAGLKVLVLDRDVAPFAQPRAIVFDAEIMRVFDSIGLAETLACVTRPLGGSVYLGADRRPTRTFRSPGPAHAHAWAPSNLFYQPQLEGLIRDGLARFPNVTVLAGCEATEVTQTGDAVRVQVNARAGGDFEAVGRFVLACDGASSTVRKRLGIRLDDIGFEERWLVVDAHMNGPMRWPDTHEIPPEVRDGRYSLMICDPERPATLIPGVGTHRRWEYMLPPDESDAEAVDPARLRRRLAEWADPDEVAVVRSSVYRFRALVAESWRAGRVFLLGDAAHQTPPFFGQGMCHGIRDAAQLMWKLAATLRGDVSLDILDTYQVEREPHVRAIIAASVKAGAAVCITDPERARARDAEFRAIEAARGSATVAMTDVVPPIRDGLIDKATGGQRLPEFAVRDGDGTRRLDGLLGGKLAILSRGPSGLPLSLARLWEARGGVQIEIAEPGLGAWAAVVRPDRYIYGTARDAGELRVLVETLLDRLPAPVRQPELESATP